MTNERLVKRRSGQRGRHFKNKGGRPKGSLNKTTLTKLARKEEALAALIDSGKPLAVSVLQKALDFAEGAVSNYKPTMKAQMAKGALENPDGDHQRFGEWFDRWFKCITEMASYQTPKMRAIDAPGAAPLAKGTVEFKLRVFEGGRQIEGPIIDNETGEEIE